MNDNSMNLAAVIASNSFYVGGNWGFVLKENEEYEKIINILKSNNKLAYTAPLYIYFLP